MTLIEVLITVTIIAIGLLGVGAMLTLTLREAQRSALHAQSTLLAQSVTDRMSANTAGVWLSAYDGAIAANEVANMFQCTTQSCDPVQLAQSDRNMIARELAQLGANAALTIACNPATAATPSAPYAGSCDLDLEWNEVGDAGAVSQELVWRFIP